MEVSVKSPGIRKFLTSPVNLVLLAALAVSGYFGVTRHWEHVLPVLPWLGLLACPLMHVFMMGRHGGHGHSGAQKEKDPHQD